MTHLTPQAEALFMDFGRQPDVTPEHVKALRAVLNESPTLTAQFNDAVEQKHLLKIVPLTNPNAGGEYHPNERSMHLPLAALTPGSSHYSPGNLTFVLGHELQHGFNRTASAAAGDRFEEEVTRIARSPAALHDYTPAIAHRLVVNRRDEASAELAGWNAVVSAVKSSKPIPTLEDIYKKAPTRMDDFIVRSKVPPHAYTLKPDLHLNPDMTLSPTPANVEAMGQNFFDKAAKKTNVGHHGNSDYANYYGAPAVGRAAELERHYNPPTPGVAAPQMAVDMTRLRLSEKLLEENGIWLGRDRARMPYIDLGGTPPTAHHLDHTYGTHAHVPIPSGAPSREEGSDYLDAYCAALQRGDRDACTALARQHMQQPHMQEMAQRGRELYEAELQRQPQDLMRQEQLRREQLQREQEQGLQEPQQLRHAVAL